MKKRIKFFLVAFIALFLSSNRAFAQVKVFPNGLVGIGMTSVDPINKLTIDGSEGRALQLFVNHYEDWQQSSCATVTNPNTCNWVVTYNYQPSFYVHGSGWIYSSGQYLGSDSTLKYNIKPQTDALSKILKINTYSYNLKSDMKNSNRKDSSYAKKSFSAGLHYGFVAQDMEKIFPELVKESTNGTKAIAYYEVIPLLTRSIQEQQNQIDLLNTQLRACCKNKLSLDSASSNYKSGSSGGSMASTALEQNKPNPFNNETEIYYTIPSSYTSAALYITDLNGTLRLTFKISSSGRNKVTIKNTDLNAGMFLYTLVIDDVIIDTKRMILTY